MSRDKKAPNSIKLLDSAEHCISIYKPDALERGLTKKIDLEIARSGLTIALRKIKLLGSDQVMQIWPTIPDLHRSRTVPYMTSGEVEGVFVSGKDATKRMLEIKKCVRGQFMDDANPVVSILHTTDCDAELRVCYEIFFNGQENE